MKKVLAIMLSLVMVFAITACGGGSSDDGSLEAVKEAGVLKIGAEGNWAPYVYHNEDGELSGFEVDMAKEIAARLGVEAEFDIADSWDGVLAGIEADRYNVVICGCGPTPERQEAYEVGIPYGEQMIALVVAEDSEIAGFEDLEGKISANSLTSSSGKIAESYGAELREADLAQGVMLIERGDADCTVNDAAAVYAYMDANPDAKVKVAAFYEPENAYEIQSAPIIKKGNVALREAIDAALEEIISDGTAKKLCAKHFGADYAENVTLYQ